VRALDPARAVAFDRKQLLRDIAAEQRKVARAKAARLRVEAKAARASRKPRTAAVRAQCAVERAELRASCAGRREAVRSDVRAVVGRTRAELERDRLERRELRAAERFGRVFAQPKARASAAERGAESDDAVRANVDPSLWGYFDRVKRGIHGTAHKSRTEAFLQYVEETPEELAAFLAEHGDEAADAMIAEYERRAG
jgi:hypothetical protein